jgi:hypothetical protein
MLMAEISFARAVRTNAKAQRHFPAAVETVEQALDYVQELPLPTLRADHWYTASRALWDAVDFPADTERLQVADKALCAALAKQGWLDETPPA